MYKIKFYRIFALFKKDLRWVISNKSILNYLSFTPILCLIGFSASVYFNKLPKINAPVLLFVFLLVGFISAMKMVLLEKEEQLFFHLLTSPLKDLEFLISKLIYPFSIISVFIFLIIFTNAFTYNQTFFLNPLLIFNLFLMGILFCLLGFTFGVHSKNILEKTNLSLGLFIFLTFLLILSVSLKNATLPSGVFMYYPDNHKLLNFIEGVLHFNKTIYFFNPFALFFELFKSSKKLTLLWSTGFHISYFFLVFSIALSSIRHAFSQINRSFVPTNQFIAFLCLLILSGLSSPFLY